MKKFRGKKYYKPSEVATLGLLKSRNNPEENITNPESVLRIIREDKIRVRDLGKVPGHPYYYISETEIDRYNAQIK